MFDHVSIGVKQLGRAKQFYDAALEPLGYQCLSESKESLGYGKDTVRLWVLAVDRPVPADSRSGLHLCLTAASRKVVDGFHAAALRHGGADNGPPGVRAEYDPKYYAAFIIDPEGYRLEAYCGSEGATSAVLSGSHT